MFKLDRAFIAALIAGLSMLAPACNRSQHDHHSDPNALDSYIGQYEPDPNTLVTVSREDTHLTIQVNHQGSLALFPESEDSFVHKDSGTRITFVKDAAGQVTHLILDRNGRKSEARRRSQPAEDRTQTIVLGDRQVRFLTTGAGQPTVILWSGIDAWSKIQHGLEKSVRVVSFDRVKTNRTPPKPGMSTPSQAAHELHAALEQAKLSPPYVLVGHSFGGALVRVFANIYTHEVAGIVLVDPFQEEFVEWLKAHQPGNYEQFVSRGRQVYVSDWEGTLSELRAASSFPDIPVTLLSATNRKPQTGDAIEQGIGSTEFAEGSEAITSSQSTWLSKIPHGKLIKIAGSSHNIPDERPEAVVQAVIEIIQQINNSKH